MTRRVNWSRVLVYGLVPTFVLLLANAAGLLKWHDSSIRHIERARSRSVAAAQESTDAILTFRYDTIDHDAAVTLERLTGGSCARVTLDKIGERWLISDFDHY